QQTGASAMGRYPEPNSPVADHIIPAEVFWHDGRQHLFWDEDNIQTVTKHYHDTTKQSLDRKATT
ncbi:MAG: hypothetical protein GY952_12580, partial [Rhodobacteraceae bacterium]|nr:hypothetical protein [Paracoccaceae bacterium]